MHSSDMYRQSMKVRSTKELQLFEGMFLAQAHRGETDLSMYRGSAILRRGVKSMCRTGYADYVWRVQSRLTEESFVPKRQRRGRSRARTRRQVRNNDLRSHLEASEEVKQEDDDDAYRLYEALREPS